MHNRKQLIQIAIATGLAFLVLVSLVFASTTRSSSSGPAQSSSANVSTETHSSESSCSRARLNPHKIQAPVEPDTNKIKSVWPTLRAALNGNADLPVELERPPFHSRLDLNGLRERTGLLNETQAAQLRDQHAKFIGNLTEYPDDTFSGRGIVILAGGVYSEYAAISLGMLREAGSTLPVEVWVRDEREEKHGWCPELEAEGMACRRLSDYLGTDLLKLKDGKEMKVFAMLFSSFEEIVLIDADNMPLQPPEKLFESEEYRETGVLLWPDLWRNDNVDWIEYIAGISDSPSEALWNKTSFESGQITWDKKRHWKSLLLAVYYNYLGPPMYYTLLNSGQAGWGEKDTFPLALRALNEPFTAIPFRVRTAWHHGQKDNKIMGLLQMAPASQTLNDPEGHGTAIFLHSTNVKWSHRDFLCIRCLPIWPSESPTDPFVSRYEDPLEELSSQLGSNVRILDEDMFQYMPPDLPDAEVRIWRAMEHAACRSPAWRQHNACAIGRGYMQKTFGFGFDPDGEGEFVPKMEDPTCLIDPP
ncbi:hypothetical protein D0867_02909 [Hortaea werneckii]|uniref:Alpha-1,2-mannosyltransferase n=1 Tax=Hortaea werneckii TaxID=91943 RepID=A0A3M7A3W0_HORWE|nr:hypothetical protein D0867_02909 [Hortaea werneckii]